MDLGKSIKKGLRFCINPKRWFPFFLIDLLGFAFLIAIFNTANLFELSISTLPVLFLEIILLFILWFVAKLLINGAVIYQSYKEKDYKNSFLKSYRKILSMLGASVVILAINIFVNTIPYIGLLLMFISLLVFYFVYQNILIKNMKFNESLEYSFELFKNNWCFLIITAFVLGILSGIILLIFSIPLLYVSFTILVSAWGTTTLGILEIINSKLSYLFIYFLIAMIGKSISRVFYIKAQTEIYLQIIKKR